MGKGLVKVLLFGAAAGAVWYFLNNSLNPQPEEGEDEDFDDFSDDDFFEEDEAPVRKYVTLDREALKEKAGDVIDKVAPVFDSASKKVSPLIEKAAPIIEAAKDKVSGILGNDEDYEEDDVYEEADETAPAEEAAADAAKEESSEAVKEEGSADAVKDLDAALDSVEESSDDGRKTES